MSATRRRAARLLFLLLLAAGCNRQATAPRAWIWPGAHPENTLWFAQAGQAGAGRFGLHKLWEAEKYPIPDAEPLPAVAMAAHHPVLADMNRDGYLEIITAPLSAAPSPALSWQGLLLTGTELGRPHPELEVRTGKTNPGVVDSVRIVAGDSAGFTMLADMCFRDGGLLAVVMLRGRPAALLMKMEPEPPFFARVLVCRDAATGAQNWRYTFAARPFLMAVTDLDGDGRKEFLFTTYGEENGVTCNGTSDQDSGYCVALKEDGTRLWQRGFGAYPFSGCLASVADLNSDGRPEVAVAYYTWQNRYGGLAVLDGATGRELARAEGTGESHVSLGCADLDRDQGQELVVATAGAASSVAVYRLESGQLVRLAFRELGRAQDTAAVRIARLHALCDLDGDQKCELVVSEYRVTRLCADPVFYPSKCDSCRLLVLDPELATRQEVEMNEKCQQVTVGDVIPGRGLELLVVTDRLTLYATDTGTD